MFCKNCGNEIGDSDKFCSKCGKKNSDVKSNFLIKFFRLEEESINKQVENYKSISLLKSSRGKASLWIIILMLFSFAFVSLMEFNLTLVDLLPSLIFYIPLIVLTCIGKKWGIASFLVFFTIDKIISPFLMGDINLMSIILSLIIWYVITRILYAAYVVEVRRKKLPLQKIEADIEIVSVENSANTQENI